MSVSDLQKWFQSEQQSSRYEDGHSAYSGGVGNVHRLHIHEDKVFTRSSKGWEWLHENVAKWEAGAVVLSARKPRLTDRQTALIAKLEDELWERATYRQDGKPGLQWALERALQEIPRKAVAKAKAGKSRFRSCPSCGSRIALAHLDKPECPVCRSDSLIMTAAVMNAIEAAQKRLEVHKAKSQQIRDRIQAIKDAAAYDEERYWLVFALCGS